MTLLRGYSCTVAHALRTAGGNRAVSHCALSEGVEGLGFCPEGASSGAGSTLRGTFWHCLKRTPFSTKQGMKQTPSPLPEPHSILEPPPAWPVHSPARGPGLAARQGWGKAGGWGGAE